MYLYDSMIFIVLYKFYSFIFCALSFRIMSNYDSSFILSFSSHCRCLPSNGKGLARDFAAEKERERVEAPAPAIDSLEIPWFQKLLSPARTLGCHQWRTALRPQIRSSRVSSFGPGRSVKISLHRLLLARETRTIASFRTLFSCERTFSNGVRSRTYAREFGLSMSIANFVQWSERLVSARAYMYIFIWLK